MSLYLDLFKNSEPFGKYQFLVNLVINFECSSSISSKDFLFIHLERERESTYVQVVVWGGRRENLKEALCSGWSLHGVRPHNLETTTRTEVKTKLPNPLSHADTHAGCLYRSSQ